MLRDKNLIPLSHQHQHALALCVRIGKAFADEGATPDVHPWEQEIVKQFDEEILFHFHAEDKVLFPAADQHEQLQELVDSLRIEHTLIRRNVERARARQFTVTDLQVFTATLSEHIRKEERLLFEQMQQLLSPEELNRVGREMQAFFVSAGLPAAACDISSSPKTGPK
jgi:hemerythrin-like domain-containing protein